MLHGGIKTAGRFGLRFNCCSRAEVSQARSDESDSLPAAVPFPAIPDLKSSNHSGFERLSSKVQGRTWTPRC